jgi:hypothetical protein
MNYYQAREISKDDKPTGKFHYTRMNDGDIRPVGYCASNCPGHDTPEEAAEHYRQYLIDNAQYDHKMLNQQKQCQICGQWTDQFATTFQYGLFVLCPEHCNRESLEKVHGKVESIISSY